MDTCDVLIAGGGPAGSTCASALVRAGLGVMIVDRATFPRDKVCGGWITPQVVDALRLDISTYADGRTFQPFTGFRVGLIGTHRTATVHYGQAVSYGIRRCEFDAYLLHRSGARLALGTRVDSLVRDGRDWVVNDAIRTPMLVGAGGHFCPVARLLNRGHPDEDASLVVAQEAEFPMPPEQAATCAASADVPELYFCRDFSGYGWYLRKGEYVNVGIGRLDRHSLPRAAAQFIGFLQAAQQLSAQWTLNASYARRSSMLMTGTFMPVYGLRLAEHAAALDHVVCDEVEERIVRLPVLGIVVAAALLDVARQALRHDPRIRAVFLDDVGDVVADHGGEPAHLLDRPLATGEGDGLLDLVAVEGLPLAAALDDHDLAQLDALERGEARAAAFALAPPADRGVVFRWAGVFYLRVIVGTKRTAHRGSGADALVEHDAGTGDQADGPGKDR